MGSPIHLPDTWLLPELPAEQADLHSVLELSALSLIEKPDFSIVLPRNPILVVPGKMYAGENRVLKTEEEDIEEFYIRQAEEALAPRFDSLSELFYSELDGFRKLTVNTTIAMSALATLIGVDLAKEPSHSVPVTFAFKDVELTRHEEFTSTIELTV